MNMSRVILGTRYMTRTALRTTAMRVPISRGVRDIPKEALWLERVLTEEQ